jgi:hypothetical protein
MLAATVALRTLPSISHEKLRSGRGARPRLGRGGLTQFIATSIGHRREAHSAALPVTGRQHALAWEPLA